MGLFMTDWTYANGLPVGSGRILVGVEIEFIINVGVLYGCRVFR